MQGQVKRQAATLVSALITKTTATKKRTDSIRSNLHTGQYAGSVSSDHSQGQALVEPLVLPAVTRHTNKFLCKAGHSKRGGGLAIHTSPLNCNWLNMVIAFNAGQNDLLRMELMAECLRKQSAEQWLFTCAIAFVRLKKIC